MNFPSQISDAVFVNLLSVSLAELEIEIPLN